MAVLTTKKRKKLPTQAFAYPEGRKLPIHDAAHVRSAIGRFGQTQLPSMAAARAAARRIVRAARRFKISLSPDSAVARLAGLAKAKKTKPRRRNPGSGSKALEAAKRLSKRFHGNVQVVELNDRERRPLPRYVAVVGELDELTYSPDPRSKRGSVRWRHESGDRGPGRPRARSKPLVVVDPRTKRPAIVAHRSPLRFSSDRGLVG